MSKNWSFGLGSLLDVLASLLDGLGSHIDVIVLLPVAVVGFSRARFSGAGKVITMVP